MKKLIHNVVLSIIIVLPYLFTISLTGQKPPAQVTVIGAGYVGLVSSVIFAEYGNNVVCADVDVREIANIHRKINLLQEGHMPILERGVETLLKKHITSGKLIFTTDVAGAIAQGDLLFVAVGTPMSADGHADLSALYAVLDVIAAHLDRYKIICIKSTVPIGTAAVVKNYLYERGYDHHHYALVSNPEFLREGSALDDFIHRNPIVLGCDNELTLAFMKEFYGIFIANGLPVITTDNTTAETIKYAWNAFSAVKIAYANQIATLCNAVGADVFSVIAGMSYSDELLPMRNIAPGPGYGGSCLPKDTNALAKIADAVGVDLTIVKAVIDANERQKDQVVALVYQLLGGSVHGKTIAVLGLSFKQDTDDIRFSPAINALERLLNDGALVRAYDPAAMRHMAKLFPEVVYCPSALNAVSGADAVLLLTPWEELRTIDLAQVAARMRQRIVIDGRNLWDPKVLRALGFKFANMGHRELPIS